MKVRKQFTIMLDNAPGQLAKLCSSIKRAKSNIQAISVEDSKDVGLVRVVVSNAKAAKAALKKSGFALTEQSVIEVSLPDKPGQLADIASKLAKAKVNISYVYGSACDSAACNCEGQIVIVAVDDMAKASKIIK